MKGEKVETKSTRRFDMSVLRARMITTNNYFCRDVYIFKGYICSSTMHEFHMLSKLSIYSKEVL